MINGHLCPGTVHFLCRSREYNNLTWHINANQKTLTNLETIAPAHIYDNRTNYPLVLATFERFLCFQVIVVSGGKNGPGIDDVDFSSTLDTDLSSLIRYRLEKLTCEATASDGIRRRGSLVRFNFTLRG